MRSFRYLICAVIFTLGLSACGNQIVATPTVENVTVVATARGSDPGYTNIPSNGVITFTDSVSGISLDYPEGWIMDQVRGGTRSPSVFVFTNYFHIPALMDKIDPEDTAVYLTVFQPNPEATLPGLIDSYKQQWVTEGSTIATEENVTLASGQPGTVFYVDSYLGRQVYHLFTMVGDKLVLIEAIGNLAPVPAVALSLR